jgi:hypothetical protein
VWPENLAAVEVFTSCRWVTKVIAGMEGGARIYEGIEAGEISHCCDLLGIPKEERRDVLWGVRIMEQVAMPILNSR